MHRYGTWHLSELSAKSTRMIYVYRILIQIEKKCVAISERFP